MAHFLLESQQLKGLKPRSRTLVFITDYIVVVDGTMFFSTEYLEVLVCKLRQDSRILIPHYKKTNSSYSVTQPIHYAATLPNEGFAQEIIKLAMKTNTGYQKHINCCNIPIYCYTETSNRQTKL